MQFKLSMRRALACASLLTAGLLSAGPSYAADTGSEPRDTAALVNGMRIKRLVEPLALTTEQQQKFKSLMDEESKKIAESQANTTVERTERITQQRAIKTEYRKKMEEVLTPEQREKWAKLDADAQSGRRRRGTTPPKAPAGENAPTPKAGAAQ